MKFRKAITFLAASAITASCMTSTFAIGAGAASYDGNYTPNADYSFSEYLERNETRSTPTYTLGAEDPTTIQTEALRIMHNRGLSSVIFSVSKYYKYTVTLSSEFIHGNKWNLNGTNRNIDIALNIIASSDPNNPYVKICPSNLAGNSELDIDEFKGTVKFKLNGDVLPYLLNERSIAVNRQLRLYTKDYSGNETTVKIITDTGNDLNLEFSAGTMQYYIAAYDNKNADNKYYTKTESEPAIAEILGKTIGYDATAETAETISTYIASEVNRIKTELFKLDEFGNSTADIKYVTAEEITNFINKYYTDGGNTYAKEHRRALADAVVNALARTSDIDKALTKNITSLFGYDLSDYTISQLKSLIITDIVTRAETETADKLSEINQYVPIVRYFFDSWALDATSRYNKLVTYITEKLGADYGKARVIAMISDYEYSAADSNKVSYLMRNATTDAAILSVASMFTGVGSTISYGGNVPLVSAASTAYEILRTKDASVAAVTESQWLSTLVGTAYDLAVKYNPGLATITGSQWIESLKLVSAYDLARKNESEMNAGERAWLETLRSAASVTTTPITTTTTTTQNGYLPTGSITNPSGAESFTDWATRLYGSVDGFIASIVRQVQQEVTYGSNGASAYEIAVKYGFKGTEKEWLDSLKGADGKDGKDGQDGRDGRDGRDGKDGRDGEDGRIIYANGSMANAAAPATVDDSLDSPYGTTGNYPEIVIEDMDDSSVPAPVASIDISVNPSSRVANPSTGVVAGILLPAAAVVSVGLLRKGKRKRGRK